MKSRPRASWPVLSALAMTLLIAGAAGAQVSTATQTSEIIKFEVISVDGNTLVVRDQTGTREVTVPEDFRFTVDGKSMSVHELTPGMKGTAQVTTTTVVRPVHRHDDQERHGREAGSKCRLREDRGWIHPQVHQEQTPAAWHPGDHGWQARAPRRPEGRRPADRHDRHVRLRRRSSRQRMCRPYSIFLSPPPAEVAAEETAPGTCSSFR